MNDQLEPDEDDTTLTDEDVTTRSIWNGTIAAGALGLFITIVGAIAWFAWTVTQ